MGTLCFPLFLKADTLAPTWESEEVRRMTTHLTNVGYECVARPSGRWCHSPVGETDMFSVPPELSTSPGGGREGETEKLGNDTLV